MILPLRWLVVGGVALFLASLHYLSSVYASLTIAFVLAYLLAPVVDELETRRVSRDFAVPLVLVLFFVGLGLSTMAVVPKLVAQGRDLVSRIPTVYASVTTALGPYSEQYLGFNVFQDVDKLLESLGDASTFVKPIGGLVGGVAAGTFKFVTAVLGLLIIPLMAYYLLHDFPEIYTRLLYVIPVRHHGSFSKLCERLDGVLGGFIRGQLVVSSILSVYYGTAFALLRLELALVLGLMAGFFNIVPYIGITSVLVLTLLIAFIHGATVGTYAGIGIVFAIGMAIEGSFLTPRIVGRKVGLRPLMLIIALLVGGELKGLVGMLLAVPIAAILKVVLGMALERYRSSEAFRRMA